MSDAPRIVLASGSARRPELLAGLNVTFEVAPTNVDETSDETDTAMLTRNLAELKARAGSAAAPGAAVVGADTLVVLDGRILGKPRDRAHALAMLAALSDREHEVYSAVAVCHRQREAVRLSVTRVRFAPISAAEASAYWDSGEPADKAGAYGIQGLGALFVREIHGSYSGVVGLPLHETAQLLRTFAIEVLAPSSPSLPPRDA